MSIPNAGSSAVTAEANAPSGVNSSGAQISSDFADSQQGGGNGQPGSNTTGNRIPIVPITNPTPISADSLGMPASPVTIPTAPKAAVTTPVVSAPAGTTVNENGTATVTPANTSSTGTGTADTGSGDTSSWIKNAMMKIINEQSTEGAATEAISGQQGIDTKTQQATNDYNAYTIAKNELDNQVANIRENSSGMSKEAVDEAISEAQFKGNSNISNLALQSSISQGNLSAAQKIVSDKIAAQFGSLNTESDMLTKFATINDNDLTDSEKTQITANADKLKTDTSLVQSSSTSAHDVLMKGNAPTSAYSQLDAITAKYTAGQISATEAQSEYDQVAGKYDTSGDTSHDITNADGSTSVVKLDASGKVISTTDIGGGGMNTGLSKTEFQKGVSNAATDAATFQKLPSDVQSFFATADGTTMKDWNAAVTSVQAGTDPSQAIKDNDLNLSTNTLAYLKTYAPAASTSTSSGGGGFMGWLKGIFSGGGQNTANAGSTSTTTVMTGPDGQQYNVPNEKVDTFKQNGFN